MIYNAPTINVSGIGKLKIYGIDFSAQTIDNPGRFTVSYVDLQNNLSAPTLSYVSLTSLRIGSITLKGYAVSYRRTLTVEGESLLVVTYVDESIIFDKIFVGLRNKHWDIGQSYSSLYQRIDGRGLKLNDLETYKSNAQTQPSSPPPDFLILVGSSIDPCGKDFNGSQKVDLCNPCPPPLNQNSNNESEIDCETIRSLTIFEIDYNFNELINAIGSRIPVNIIGSINVNEDYRTNYVGSLREVLQGWCSDLGLSFFYEKGKINIFSLSNGVVVPESLNLSQTISKVEENSIEHRYNEAAIAHFASEGEIRDYNCSTGSQKLVCRPVTLEDLIGKSLIGAYPANNANDYYRLIELMSMLSGYHTKLREMVTWFDVYGIRSAEDAEKIVGTKSNHSRISSIPGLGGGYSSVSRTADSIDGEYTLPLLSMTVKKVMKQGSAEFKEIMRSNVLNEGIISLLSDTSKKPYFFIASRDKNAYTNKVAWEANLAENFLGKYYLRMYETYSSSDPSIQACGSDSVSYYKQGSSSLDFGKFMPPLSDGYVNLIKNFKSNETPGSKVSTYRYTESDSIVKDSFILVNRGSNWFPTLSQGEEIDDILNLASGYEFIDLGSVGNFPDSVRKDTAQGGTSTLGLSEESKGKGDDNLYIGFTMPSGFQTAIFNGDSHPEESEDTDKNGRCRVSVDDFEVPVSLGLRSTKTRRIFCGMHSFYMPAQGCVDVAKNSGGYNVLVNNTRNIGKKLIIPKSEFVEATWPTSNNVGRININYKEIGGADIDLIVNPEEVLGGKRCSPNEPVIRQFMSDYISQSSFSNANTTLKKITYELMGLPGLNYSIEDGLIDFSVRVSGQGVRSYLTFSNLIDRVSRKNTKLLEYELRQNQIQQRVALNSIGKNIIYSNDREITS